MESNFKIFFSKSDKRPEFGCPFGKVLCKSLEIAEKVVAESDFKDLEIIDYDD